MNSCMSYMGYNGYMNWISHWLESGVREPIAMLAAKSRKRRKRWEYGFFLRFLRFFAAIPDFCNYLPKLP